MSIGGNDSGQHHAQPDPGDLGWFIAKANARTGLTAPFQTFMRTRRPHTRCQLSVLGRPTTLTSASIGTGTADPAAEQRCWNRLRAAINSAAEGNTAAAGAMLPSEIAVAEWDDNGRHIRIRRPGAAIRAVRCARRGLRATAPVPVLGALSQPLAGSATAVGLLIAPIPFNAPTEPPPFSMAVPGRTLHGEIDRPAPGSDADAHPTAPALGPGAPLLPALLPRSTLFPPPGDSSERDAAPTPATVYPPAPSSRRAAPAPVPSLTLSSSPTAEPTPTPSPTGLLDAVSPSPSPAASDAPAVEPTVSPSPIVTQSLKRHHHPRHWLHRLAKRHLSE